MRGETESGSEVFPGKPKAGQVKTIEQILTKIDFTLRFMLIIII
jgi:hypothetical protein